MTENYTANVKKLFRDPLIHFLLAGLVLFLFMDLRSGPHTHPDDKIVVDREAMLTFLKLRRGNADIALAAAEFDGADASRKAELIEKFIEEEVLYREALAMGLEADAYGRRQVLVQQMYFVLDPPEERRMTDFADMNTLREFFEANKDKYYIVPAVDVTHLMLDKASGTPEDIERLLQQKKEELNGGLVIDRRTGVMIGPHTVHPQRTGEVPLVFFRQEFGPEAADAISSLPPGTWAGPFRSAQGYHLVMVNTIREGRQQSFEEVQGYVQGHYMRDRREKQTKERIQKLAGKYAVEIDL